MINLHMTTDASIWAREFCKIFPDAPDEGTMIGWFANAMMAKADEIDRARECGVEDAVAALINEVRG